MRSSVVTRAAARRVLLVIEDATLAELLAEALADAGHTCDVADEATALARLGGADYDAAVIDLDTRARGGARLLAACARLAPAITRIALMPCGGWPPGAASPPYHLALEKPMRLDALVRAVALAPAAARN